MDTRFEIIATRAIDIIDEHGCPTGQAVVHIGRPWQEPTGEWAAPYQILGLGRPIASCVFGLDAIQALQLVQLVIGGVLAGLDESKQGRLRWADGSDLGFPLPAEPPASVPNQ